MSIAKFVKMAASDVPTPSGTYMSMFIDSADGLLKIKDSAGIVWIVGDGLGIETIVGGNQITAATVGTTTTVSWDITTLVALQNALAGTPTFALTNGNVYTGVHDFGGAGSLEVPNSAAPTVDAAGEIAIDTTITDHKPLITYYGAAAMYAVGILAADLTTVDGHIIKYDAANDKFKMAAPDIVVLDNDTTSVDLANSDVVTAVYTLAIPGGTLGTDGSIYLQAFGTEKDLTGTFTLSVTYGITSTIIINAAHINSSATAGAFILNVLLKGRGATNTQELVATYYQGGSLAAPQGAFNGTMGEDSTANKNLILTASFSVANANDAYHQSSVRVWYSPAI